MNIDIIMRVIQVLIAVAMIAIILVQRGAGASAGSGFGAGASGTVFGSRGSGSFLSRATGVLAASFFALTMAMGVMASRNIEVTSNDDLGVMSGVATDSANDTDVPALPGFSSDEANSEVPVLPMTPATESDSNANDDGG